MSKLVTIGIYAANHNKSPITVRERCQNGDFASAIKPGRDWLIDLNEPYPKDKRTKLNKKMSRG